MNVGLVAVGLEWFGLEDFLVLGAEQWAGTLLIDEERKLYKHAGTGRGSMLTLLKPSVLGSIFSGAKYKSGKSVSGNLAGDGWPLGGTFVLNSEGDAVFAHLQQAFGDHAPLDAVREAAKGLARGGGSGNAAPAGNVEGGEGDAASSSSSSASAQSSAL
eukprot:TRINITY_DN964_c0_g1_i3.p1 TRINITY_DN964_c0_g1~~TRINITY_DN964_c0_g1_i3.p1  ORF type:complete len:159 (+),score=53.41 TRINITY_DN964_c0_g1_i3:255-731(+)